MAEQPAHQAQGHSLGDGSDLAQTRHALRKAGPDEAGPVELVRQLGPHHPQLLFELPAHSDEHVLGHGVKCAEQF
jgi:hypothetical protein